MNLRYLTVYHEITKNPLMRILSEMLEKAPEEAEGDASRLVALLVEQSEKYLLEGPVLEAWAWHCLLGDVNAFSMNCERHWEVGKDSSLYKAVQRDIHILRAVLQDSLSLLQRYGLEDFALRYCRCAKKRADSSPAEKRAAVLKQMCAEYSLLGEMQDADAVDVLSAYYARQGCGILAMYPMFRWETGHGLIGVENYDDIRLSDLIGYQYQKQMLIENTEGFLEGHEANNVLLAGAGGTGKSSAVKALVNEYFAPGLRLVEVGKEQMEQLPGILQYIAGRGKRFILFIDDLSFEDFETEYKYMKSLLEGSVEKKPENVVFYATSNRRNIIQQKWKDRQTEHLDQEVHGIEAMNEKLSLSQRFGLTLTYPVPNQAQYLEIVRYLAQKQGITADKALEREAIQWSMEQKGFSGRSARQFILYYQQKKQ